MTVTHGTINLHTLWRQADARDIAEGKRAFTRYRKVLAGFANHYGFPLRDTVSAFVALSPNNDYHSNLRSLASVLAGLRDGVPCDQITVSTYNACRDRAHAYLAGKANFLKTVRGPKIRAFRDNIMRPNTSDMVTVDGHMVAAWFGERLTMKQAAHMLKSRWQYDQIADGIRHLASEKNVRPCQAQAILWMTRKRTLDLAYDPQLNMFRDPSDVWRTMETPQSCPPFVAQERVGA